MEGYTNGFGAALSALNTGRRVARAGWNGKGMYLELQIPDEHSKMQRPYIYIVPGEGFTTPWVASQADILAEDWFEVTD